MARKAKKKDEVKTEPQKYVQPKSKRMETYELAQSLGFDCEINDDGVLIFYCKDDEDREKNRAWCLDHITEFSWGLYPVSHKNKRFNFSKEE